MSKDKHHAPITNKAMLPKKHSEMRFCGEIQVPESVVTARVKGKQTRYFHVVIKSGPTAPIKDNIIATAVDLTNKGIEIQLKLFLAWRSRPEDTCLVMVSRKTSLPYIVVK